MTYSSTLKTLSPAKLDALLKQYGASTFGSTERKLERLQRFLDAHVDRELADVRRMHNMTTRSQTYRRIETLVTSYLA